MGLLLRVVGDKAPVAEGSTSRTEGPLFPFADCASFTGVYRSEARSRACFFSAGIIVKDKMHHRRKSLGTSQQHRRFRSVKGAARDWTPAIGQCCPLADSDLPSHNGYLANHEKWRALLYHKS